MCICNYIVSFFIGVIAGIASSWIVAKHFRRKDDERDTNIYLREMNRYVSNMAFQLYVILNKAANYPEPEREIESVISNHENKPKFEKRFKLSTENERIINEINSIDSRVDKQIGEYTNIKLIIDGEDNLSSADLEKWKSLRKQSITELGALSTDYHTLLQDANNKLE